MREKTILQGLGYMMGFGVPVSERNGDISSTIRRARLYPTSYIAGSEESAATCTVCRLLAHVDYFRIADHPEQRESTGGCALMLFPYSSPR